MKSAPKMQLGVENVATEYCTKNAAENVGCKCCGHSHFSFSDYIYYEDFCPVPIFRLGSVILTP